MELIKEFPSVTKYMGSKTEVLDLIEKGFEFLGKDYECICDLFAGSATLSAALRNKANVISNDIQSYSEIFATVYLSNYSWKDLPSVQSICDRAKKRADKFFSFFQEMTEDFSYDKDFSLAELNELEDKERALIGFDKFSEFDNYYLFVKNYSGTYWSYEQCVWIDSYRAVIDEYKDDKAYYSLLLTCLIYAMAYNSQSTGHYAQYRVPDNDKSKDDILIYRRKNITDFFLRKYEELKGFLNNKNEYSFETMSVSDVDCLKRIPEHSLVYADPPYCFVHYSRFYHAIETLVKYDYPDVKFKGRYRTDRFQSNYCIKTEVAGAFSLMFDGVRTKKADLMLSYTNSDTNTIMFEDLIREYCSSFVINEDKDGFIEIALKRSKMFFENPEEETIVLIGQDDAKEALDYEISMIKKPYNHSRMGRKDTKTIPVTEIVILAKYMK